MGLSILLFCLHFAVVALLILGWGERRMMWTMGANIMKLGPKGEKEKKGSFGGSTTFWKSQGSL